MKRSFYLLTYDIADKKRLAKIAKTMEAVAERVQDSVFEAWLGAAELEKTLKKANKIMNDKEDSLRVYSLCDPCREKIRCLGQGKPLAEPAVVII
jgi:CRISPR-associated protein Cas2